MTQYNKANWLKLKKILFANTPKTAMVWADITEIEATLQKIISNGIHLITELNRGTIIDIKPDKNNEGCLIGTLDYDHKFIFRPHMLLFQESAKNGNFLMIQCSDMQPQFKSPLAGTEMYIMEKVMHFSPDMQFESLTEVDDEGNIVTTTPFSPESTYRILHGNLLLQV